MADDLNDVVRRLDRAFWRLDALDEWRKEVDGRLAVLDSEVLTVREGRIVDETLRRQLLDSQRSRTEHQRVRLTWWQQAGATVVIGVSLAELVKGLF